MRIIVTGALGHIGSAFIRNTLFENFDVEFVLIDDFSTQRFTSLFGLEGAHYVLIEGSVKHTLTPKMVSSADAVVHLAAIADPGLSTIKPREVYQHNLSNTRHAIACCVSAGVPLVFPSSTSVYGSSNPTIKEADETPQPHTPYARGKLAEEDAIRVAFDEGLPGAILRFGTIFGVSPGMRFHTAVNLFCWQATVGNEVSVYRTAMEQLRPYLAVEDASNSLAHTVLDSCYHKEAVNISTSNATVTEILKEIRMITPNLVVRKIDSLAMNEHSFGVSTVRAEQLGYLFSGDLRSGIQATMDLISGIRHS